MSTLPARTSGRARNCRSTRSLSSSSGAMSFDAAEDVRQELEVGIKVRDPAFGLEVGGIVNELLAPAVLLLPPLLFLLQNVQEVGRVEGLPRE